MIQKKKREAYEIYLKCDIYFMYATAIASTNIVQKSCIIITNERISEFSETLSEMS